MCPLGQFGAMGSFDLLCPAESHRDINEVIISLLKEAQLNDAVAQSWREASPQTKAYYEQRATRINAVEEKKYLQQIRAR